jgi:hypothetical protein
MSTARQTKKLNIVDRPLGKGRQEVRAQGMRPSLRALTHRPVAARLTRAHPAAPPPPRRARSS